MRQREQKAVRASRWGACLAIGLLWLVGAAEVVQAGGGSERKATIARSLGQLVWAIQDQKGRTESEATRQKEAFEQLWRWVRARQRKTADQIWQKAEQWIDQRPVGTGDEAALRASARDWLDNRKLGSQESPTEEDILLRIGFQEASKQDVVGWRWRRLLLLCISEIFEEGRPPFTHLQRNRLLVRWLPVWLNGSLLPKMVDAQRLEKGLSTETKKQWRGVVIPWLLQEEGRLDRSFWKATHDGTLAPQWRKSAYWLRESYQMLGGALLFAKAPPLGKKERTQKKSPKWRAWKDLVAHPLMLAARRQELLSGADLWMWSSLVEQAQERPEIAFGGGLLMLKMIAQRPNEDPSRKQLLRQQDRLLKIILEKCDSSLQEKQSFRTKEGWGWTKAAIQSLVQEIGGWDQHLPDKVAQTAMNKLRMIGKVYALARWRTIQSRISQEIRDIKQSDTKEARVISGALKKKIQETHRQLERTLKNPFVLYGMIDAFHRSPPKVLEETLAVHWWMKHAIQESPALVGRALEEISGSERVPLLVFQVPERVTWRILLEEASRTTLFEPLRGRWFVNTVESIGSISSPKKTSAREYFPEDPWETWTEADLFRKWWKEAEEGQAENAKKASFWLAWLGVPKDHESQWKAWLQKDLSMGKELRLNWEIGKIGRGLEAKESRRELVELFFGKSSIDSIKNLRDLFREKFQQKSSASLQRSDRVTSSLGYRVAFDLLWLVLRPLQKQPHEERNAFAAILGDVDRSLCTEVAASSFFTDKCMGLIGLKLSLQEREDDIPLKPIEFKGFQHHPTDLQAYSDAQQNPKGFWGYGFWVAMWRRGLIETRFKRRIHLLIEAGDPLDRAWKALNEMRHFVEQRSRVTALWAEQSVSAEEVEDALPSKVWPWSNSCIEDRTRSCSMGRFVQQALRQHVQQTEELGEDHDQLQRLISSHRALNDSWPNFSPRYVREKLEAEIKALRREEDQLKEAQKQQREAFFKRDALTLLKSPVLVAWETHGARLAQAQAQLLRAKALLQASTYSVEEQKLLQMSQSLINQLVDLRQKRLNLFKMRNEAKKRRMAAEKRIQELRLQRAALNVHVAQQQRKIAAIDHQIRTEQLDEKKQQLLEQIHDVALLKNEYEVLEEMLVKPHQVKTKGGKTITVKGKIGEVAYKASLRMQELEKQLRQKLAEVKAAKGKAEQRIKTLEEAERVRVIWQVVGIVVGAVAAVAYVAVTVATGGATAAALPVILKTVVPTAVGIYSAASSAGNIGGYIHSGVISGQSPWRVSRNVLPEVLKLVSELAAAFGGGLLFQGGQLASLGKALGKFGQAMKTVDSVLQYVPKAIEFAEYIFPALRDTEEQTIPLYFTKQQQQRLSCLLKREVFWSKLFLAGKPLLKDKKSLEKKEIVSFAGKLKSYCEDSENKDKDFCKKLKDVVASCPNVSSETVAIIDVAKWAVVKSLPLIHTHKLVRFYLLFEGLRFLQKEKSFEQARFESHLKKLLQANQNANASNIAWVVEQYNKHFDQKSGADLTWPFVRLKLDSLMDEFYKDYPDLPEQDRADETVDLIKKARRILDSGYFAHQIEQVVAKWKIPLEEHLSKLKQHLEIPAFQSKSSDEKGQLREQIAWLDDAVIPRVENGIVYVGKMLQWLQSGDSSNELAEDLRKKKEELQKEENKLRNLVDDKRLLSLRTDQSKWRLQIGENKISAAELAKQVEEIVLETATDDQRSFAVSSTLEERIKQEELQIKRQQQAFGQAASQERLKSLDAVMRAAKHRLEAKKAELLAIEKEKRPLEATLARLTPNAVRAAQQSDLQKQIHRHTQRIRAKVAKILHWLRYFDHHLTICGSTSPKSLSLSGNDWATVLEEATQQLLDRHRHLSSKSQIEVSDLFLKPTQIDSLFGQDGLLVEFKETLKPKPVRKEQGRIVFELQPARCRAVLWVGVVFGGGVNLVNMKPEPVRYVARYVRSWDPSNPKQQKDFHYDRSFVFDEKYESAQHETLYLQRDLTDRMDMDFVIGPGTLVGWLRAYDYFRQFAGLGSRTWRELWGLPMSGPMRFRIEHSQLPEKARLVWLHVAYPK